MSFRIGPPMVPPNWLRRKRILRRREEVAGVEVAVADELEQAAVNLVRSGLRDRIHHRVGVQAVARGDAVRLDAELLQRVGKRERQVDVGMRVVVIAAVEQVVVAVLLAARDGYADRADVIVRRDEAPGGVRRNARAAGKQDQIGRLPAVQGRSMIGAGR